MKNRRLAVLAITSAIGLTLAACGGSSSKTATDTAKKDSAPAAASSTKAAETKVAGTKASDTITVTSPAGAVNTGFTEKTLSAPANTPLTINFTNDDAGMPHNIQIFTGDKAEGTPVFAPTGDTAMVTGPGNAAYKVPGLAAGTYTVNCAMHPTTMIATLVVA